MREESEAVTEAEAALLRRRSFFVDNLSVRFEIRTGSGSPELSTYIDVCE